MASQSFRGAGGGGAVVARYGSLRRDYELTTLGRELDADLDEAEKLMAEAASALLLVVVLLIGAWLMTA
jgi:hypothetical protein